MQFYSTTITFYHFRLLCSLDLFFSLTATFLSRICHHLTIWFILILFLFFVAIIMQRVQAELFQQVSSLQSDGRVSQVALTHKCKVFFVNVEFLA